jgi:hypothetical protein
MKELYLAPFAFIDSLNNSGYLVFTAQVPWLHDLHRFVIDEMKYDGRRNVPHVCDDLEKAVYKEIGWWEEHLYPFTTDGCYPNVNDVEEGDLYERAMEVTCACMNEKLPPDWKQLMKVQREKLLERRGIGNVPTIAEFNDFKPARLPLSEMWDNSTTDPLAADEYPLAADAYAPSTPVQKLKLSSKKSIMYYTDNGVDDAYALNTPVQNKRHCGSPFGTPIVLSDNDRHDHVQI